MAKRSTQTSYQHEPLVTPSNWQGDERRFSIRLSQLLDELFNKFGRADTRLKTLEKSGGTGGGSSISLLDVYPVGSVYMSVNELSPETLFGGTWERLKDTFLLAAGDAYAPGSEGGEAEHTLTVEEMPSHKHSPVYFSSGTTRVGLSGGTAGADYNYYKLSYTNTSGYLGTSFTTAETGGDKSHNNMPPYLAVYMWKRTA